MLWILVFQYFMYLSQQLELAIEIYTIYITESSNTIYMDI